MTIDELITFGDEIEDDEEDRYEGTEDLDCGMDGVGSCQYIGSEECDGECPFRDELDE